MSKDINKGEEDHRVNIGVFTRNAVENFEENIINKKDYLEEVKEHRENNH